jgi:hypothetical protein
MPGTEQAMARAPVTADNSALRHRRLISTASR